MKKKTTIKPLSKGEELEELFKIILRVDKRYQKERRALAKKILLDTAKEMDVKGFKLVRLCGENGYQRSAAWGFAIEYLTTLGSYNLNVFDILGVNKYMNKHYKLAKKNREEEEEKKYEKKKV